MMLHKNIIHRSLAALSFAVAILAPMTASAYLLPEDVLLNDEFFAPPQAREADAASRAQARESAARRDAEFQAEYDRQHPAAPEPVVEDVAPQDTSAEETLNLDGEDLELLRTIRLLERIDQQQDLMRYQAAHTGAPPLAPTGAGSIVAALTMLGAIGWTMRRAGKLGGAVRTTQQ